MRRSAILPLAALFAWVSAGASTASAQEVAITAHVDTDHVALNEQILLEVDVTGDRTDLPEPAMPSLPNFQVYSSGRSQNVTISNGKIQSTIVYSYVLVPRFVGDAVIPPITVSVAGQSFSTSPISIKVGRPSAPGAAGPSPAPTPAAPQTPGAAAPSRPRGNGPDLFVTAKVDRPKCYVGEQVTLSVRFYTGVELLGNPEYIPPATQGFLSEDLPPLRNSQATDQGRAYYYTEIKTALFPLEPGPATIANAVVRAQVRQDAAVDPFAPDFFQKFFSQGLLAGQTRELRTEPLTVHVLPLPDAGKPAAFSGAVGRFSVKAEVSKTKVQVGDAIDLLVTVEGEGNLRTSGDLRLPAMDDFQVYDTVNTLSLSKKDDVVRSVKTYKTVLVPKASGQLKIPPIEFNYFDPAEQRYVARQSDEIEVQATPGAARPAPAAAAPTPGLVAVASDIRFIKEGSPAGWSLALDGVSSRRWPHAIPLLALALCAGWSSYLESLARDPRAHRARRALLKARDSIRSSEKAGRSGRPDEAANLLAGAIEAYVADKLGPDGAGLPFQKSLELLRRKHPGVPEDRLSSLKELWDELEIRRFAPKATDRKAEHHLTEAALGHLEALDKELRS